MRTRSTLIMSGILLTILLSACNLPGDNEEAQDEVSTWVATTLTAQAALAPIPTSTLIPEVDVTMAPSPIATEILLTSTPQNPLVLETTLCWKGPGVQYEVVSALKKDERVELIGQGSISGWWIVDNPIYHDPCWAQAKDLLIEPGYNIVTLPIYTPPPTPTSTPTNTPTATPTATNTP
ncbi:MAG: hypothetical protein WBL25_00605 [Anaerolineales bacterium]